MAYASANLCLLKAAVGSGPQLWHYQSGDARATVEGSLYFSNAKQRGMRLGDAVIVVYTTGYVTTVHAVSVITGNAATINAAVLA